MRSCRESLSLKADFSYLGQGGNIFLYVCLLVSRKTQELGDDFPGHLVEGRGLGQIREQHNHPKCFKVGPK